MEVRTIRVENESKFRVTFDLVVKNFTEIEEYILSPPCIVHPVEWKIKVTPNTVDQKNPTDKYVSLLLHCGHKSHSKSWKCSVNADLILVSQNNNLHNYHRKIQRTFTSKQTYWGYKHFKLRDDLIDPECEFIQNDVIIFRADIKYTLFNGVESKTEINELRRTRKFNDAIVEINRRYFPVHRIVLASASDYFKTIFDHSAGKNRFEYIILEDVDADTFEIILQTIYSGYFSDITHENVYRIWKTSAFLCIPALDNFCVTYIARNLNVFVRLCDICILAKSLKKLYLLEAVQKRIAEEFVSMSGSDDFTVLPYDIFLEILQQETLQRDADDDTFSIIMYWCKRNAITDIQKFQNLLDAARLNWSKITKYSFTCALLSLTNIAEASSSMVTIDAEDLSSTTTLQVTADIGNVFIKTSSPVITDTEDTSNTSQ